MSSPQTSAQPLSMRLTHYDFDHDFELPEGAEVSYKIQLMHRIPPETETMEILVTIIYSVNDRPEPIIKASCLTRYLLTNVVKEPSPNTPGAFLYRVPEELNQRMNTEAVAHARALLGQQLASTPFHNSHVALSDGFFKVPTPAESV